MTCNDFREQHLAFLDDSLPEAELVAMQRHVTECPSCARRDTAIRRGLLLCRNLSPIEPSADFAKRLNARIGQLREQEERVRAAFRGPSVSGFFAVAASVLAVGVFAASAFDWTGPPPDIALEPAVVTSPALPDVPMMDHAYVASASVGVPVWPAVLLAEQVPMQVMGLQAQFATLGR